MKESYWINKQKNKTSYSALTKETDAHIAIIGAGLTGITTAYFLAQANEDVILIEADQICYGASGRNTGKVSAQHGLIYHDLINRYDKAMAKQYYAANAEALNTMESIIETHQIECNFERVDSVLYTKNPLNIPNLQDEYQAYLDIGIPCEYMNNTQSPFPYEAGLAMKQQARFDPYAYGTALAKITHDMGVPIYEQSPVQEVIKEDQGYRLTINDIYVHADIVIFATQFPFIDYGNFYFARIYSQQETIAYAKLKEKQDMDMMLSIDEYVQSFNIDEDILLYAGNEHKSGQDQRKSQQEFAYELPSMFSIDQLISTWSSQDYITFDKLPMVGKLDKFDDTMLFASGFNKWGNTTSCIAAKLLCAHALRRDSIYRMLYSPQRLSNIFSLPFVKENANVALAFIKSKLQNTSDDIPNKQEANIMELDGHKYGVYRDEEDDLHIVDIICPHMGCTLHFNNEDKTWDCPCHGSRFSYKGDIVKGPASHKLNTLDESHNSINPHILK